MSNASTKALLDQINSGKLKTDSAIILNFIKGRQDATLKNIVSHLMIPIQTVSARLSGLVDKGLIYENGMTRSEKHTIYAFEPDELIQSNRAWRIRRDKYLKCCKRMLRDFPDLIGLNMEHELLNAVK